MTNFLNLEIKNLLAKKLSILIVVLSALSFQAAAQTLNLDTNFGGSVTDASPQNYTSAVQPDGKILVGGLYGFVNGFQMNGVTRLNADGTRDTSFNVGGAGLNIGGNVLDIAVQPDGKILIGGSFGNYNGTTVGSLARLNTDGTLDTTFNVGGSGVSGGRVTWFQIQPDGKILVAGQQITGFNGTTSNGIFRLNTDGTLDNTFVSGFATAPSLEQIILLPDGKIVIGGFFTSYGGNPVGGIIRVNANGSFDNTFNSGVSGTSNGLGGMALQPDGKIVIGSDESLVYNGVPRNVVARLNANGTLDTSFPSPNLGSGSFVDSVAIQADGKILISGLINISGTRYSFARLNTDATVDTSVLNASDSYGYNVRLQADGKILLAGFFSRFAVGGEHNGFARFNANGSIDSSFSPQFTNYGSVRAIVQQADGKVIVGGQFQRANGNASNNIARFNADGTFDNTFATGTGTFPNANAQNQVNALAIQPDGKVLVGGQFATFNGSTQKLLVRLNTNGSVDTTFNLSGDVNLDLIPDVEDILVLADGKILVGGVLRKIAGQARGFLRLNADGSVDETFNGGGIGVNATVYRVLRQTDGKYIIVGQFTTHNGVSRPRVARINTDGTLDTLFTVGTGANNIVFDALLQTDGKIIIVGAFTTYNGATANRIARLNSDGTLDNSFNVGTGTNSTINSLAFLPNGKILIGGIFTTFNGAAANRLARLNANGDLDATFNSGLDTNPSSFIRRVFVQSDGKPLIGGTFVSYSGNPRNSLARLSTPIKRAPFDFDGDGKTDLSIFRPAPGEWWINRSADGSTFATQFGSSTDKIVSADYTGDGKSDVAFWRPSTGQWFVLRSEDLSFFAFPFGANGDTPVPADYDGDGKADAAVFRESSLTWFIQKSSGGTDIIGFGAAGDKPVVADYDGDGKADIAIYRNNGGVSEWWIRRSSTGVVFAAQFGAATDKPVQGDYTGDGKVDIAVWRPSNGNWFILRSEDFSFFAFPFGTSSDIPVPGDYDGDGKFDAGVFRPSNSTWFVQRSTAGTLIQTFGITGDLPLPSVFIP